MIDYFVKRRKKKVRKQVENLLGEGLTKVTHRLYKQGMISFNHAIALNKDLVGEILENNFNRLYHSADWDSALSIGSVVLQVKADDFRLTNKVANCARRTKDYQQANNLYRIALRHNKKYPEAFYNLAASMGKVEKYDMDVKAVINQFVNFEYYILPDHLNDPDFITNIHKELVSEYQDAINRAKQAKGQKPKKIRVDVYTNLRRDHRTYRFNTGNIGH